LPVGPVKTTIECVLAAVGEAINLLSICSLAGRNLNDTSNKTKFQLSGVRRMAAQGGGVMKNPLDSLWGTIICGVVLTAILYYVVKSILT
jgi:hypothetical protein